VLRLQIGADHTREKMVNALEARLCFSYSPSGESQKQSREKKRVVAPITTPITMHWGVTLNFRTKYQTLFWPNLVLGFQLLVVSVLPSRGDAKLTPHFPPWNAIRSLELGPASHPCHTIHSLLETPSPSRPPPSHFLALRMTVIDEIPLYILIVNDVFE